MEEGALIKRNVSYVYIILSIASLMLIFGSVYLVYKLSVLYGVGIGSSLQSYADNRTVISSLSPVALNLSTLGEGVLESFIAFVVALLLGGASFILLLSRRDLPSKATSKYTFMHATLSVIFILLFSLAALGIPYGYQSEYMYVPYFGFVICIGSIAYIEYIIRVKQPHRTGARGKSAFAIDPAKPFSNMVSVQQQVFSNMSGHIRVIDKHFNSAALQNFYRLMEKDIANFNKVTILTSREMLTSSFPQQITDLRNELSGYGIELDARLMDPKDTVEQHERMMLDDRTAYKIPPFNIINTRSEHITKINFGEADRRFAQLYSRAIKLDNYQVEKGRK
ncbi:MAG TPA: hypothetical protein VL944_01920 [Candidatus Acidoferrum sp.]|nr:hypothetical protein [Candidatus Acidoferrum sp.]